MQFTKPLPSEKSIKYDIDNYYVGELIGNYNNEQLLKRKPKDYALFIPSDDKNNNFILAIFYKKGSELICLNDLRIYQIDNIHNLISLKKILPKINYEMPKQMTFKEAIICFKCLFNLNFFTSFESLYDYNNLSINSFNLGKLYFCEKYKVYEDNKIIIDKQNIVYECLLKNSSAKLINNYNCTIENSKHQKIYCDYDIYNCLFYNSNDLILNLNNNRFYDLDKQYIDGTLLIGEDAYEIVEPFNNLLEKNGCDYTDSEISIRKALSLFKRYNK